MNLLKTLKKVSLKNFWTLATLCLRFPLFIFPTLSATKQCISTSTKIYGRLHYKNGPANAFRHAFWNYLIAKKCYRWKKNVGSVLVWAEKITDWHENAFPNRELAKRMDLHNNDVGRFLFKEHSSRLENQIVDVLREMASKAVKIDIQTNSALIKNQLVYLIEDK